MILTGKQILAEMGKKIEIEPFDESRVNPNSYNLSLHNELLVYTGVELDMKEPNAYKRIKIPEEGLVLEPGKLYLGRTVERTKTDGYVPMLEGRSSVGRLGLCVHVTAGFGDVGFDGYWTLELFCIQPVRIYPNVEICQIYYHTIEGEYEKYGGSGKYNGNSDIQPSMMYKDFCKGWVHFTDGVKRPIKDIVWDYEINTRVYIVEKTKSYDQTKFAFTHDGLTEKSDVIGIMVYSDTYGWSSVYPTVESIEIFK